MKPVFALAMFELEDGSTTYACHGFDENGKSVDVTKQYEVAAAAGDEGKQGFVVFKHPEGENGDGINSSKT